MCCRSQRRQQRFAQPKLARPNGEIALEIEVFDDKQLTVTCRNGHPVPLTVLQGRRDAIVACPQCGAQVHLEGKKLDQGLRQVERSMKDLQNAIKRFGR